MKPEIRLEEAADEIGTPISRDGRKQQVVRRHLENGNRIEVRRLYLFDDRGLAMELFEKDGTRPFIAARAFGLDRFRYVLDWFTYLGNRPDAMRSEIRLNRAAEEFEESARGRPVSVSRNDKEAAKRSGPEQIAPDPSAAPHLD